MRGETEGGGYKDKGLSGRGIGMKCERKGNGERELG